MKTNIAHSMLCKHRSDNVKWLSRDPLPAGGVLGKSMRYYSGYRYQELVDHQRFHQRALATKSR